MPSSIVEFHLEKTCIPEEELLLDGFRSNIVYGLKPEEKEVYDWSIIFTD